MSSNAIQTRGRAGEDQRINKVRTSDKRATSLRVCRKAREEVSQGRGKRRQYGKRARQTTVNRRQERNAGYLEKKGGQLERDSIKKRKKEG